MVTYSFKRSRFPADASRSIEKRRGTLIPPKSYISDYEEPKKPRRNIPLEKELKNIISATRGVTIPKSEAEKVGEVPLVMLGSLPIGECQVESIKEVKAHLNGIFKRLGFPDEFNQGNGSWGRKQQDILDTFTTSVLGLAPQPQGQVPLAVGLMDIVGSMKLRATADPDKRKRIDGQLVKYFSCLTKHGQPTLTRDQLNKALEQTKKALDRFA